MSEDIKDFDTQTTARLPDEQTHLGELERVFHKQCISSQTKRIFSIEGF